jgi:heptosyltransferase-2
VTKATLIVRLPNWVGDVVMALPALQAMQQSGIELFLHGKPWASDLLAATGMSILPLSKSFWQTTKLLAGAKSSDKALLLTNNFSSALMTRLAGITTVGYKTYNRGLLLKTSITKQPAQHEVQYFWDIARFASQYWFPTLQWPKKIPSRVTLPLSPAFIAAAKQILHQAKIDKPFWVLCPFAHGTGKDGKSKMWPHWRELSAKLQHQLVVCPGKSEEKLCAELVPEATILPGLNLGEYAAVLAAAERVIANDSGPMHIAAAVGSNTLGIFGVTDPHRTQPWGADYIGSIGHWPSVFEVMAHS